MRTFIHIISSVCCGIAAALILISCSGMSQEERTICDYLNSKLKPATEKITDVEIISQDSVLSIIPIQWMYKDVTQGRGSEEKIKKLEDYFDEASDIRVYIRLGVKPDEDLIRKHEGNWRRIVRVKAKAGESTAENIEVIFNDDGTPMMLGREYDEKLQEWLPKIVGITY